MVQQQDQVVQQQGQMVQQKGQMVQQQGQMVQRKAPLRQQQAALHQQGVQQQQQVPLASHVGGMPGPSSFFGSRMPAPSTSQFNHGPRANILPNRGSGNPSTPWLPNYRFNKPN